MASHGRSHRNSARAYSTQRSLDGNVSRPERTSRNAFASDPEWIAARAKTEEKGPLLQHLENYMLAPTAYSKIK